MPMFQTTLGTFRVCSRPITENGPRGALNTPLSYGLLRGSSSFVYVHDC